MDIKYSYEHDHYTYNGTIVAVAHEADVYIMDGIPAEVEDAILDDWYGEV